MTMHMICDKCKQKIKVDETTKGKITLETAQSGKEVFDICSDCVGLFQTWLQIKSPKKGLGFRINI